jgi:hypothetical protein
VQIGRKLQLMVMTKIQDCSGLADPTISSGFIPLGFCKRSRQKALVNPSSQVVMQNDLLHLEEGTSLGFNIKLDLQGFGDVGCGKDTPHAIGG